MAKVKKLDMLGVGAFCESLGLMLKAGISVSEAMDLLKQKDERNGVLEEGIEMMSKSLEAGGSLEQAMRETGLFPEYTLKMVSTG